MQCIEYSKIWLNLTFAPLNLTLIRGQTFPSVSCISSNYQITLWSRSRSTFHNLESTMGLAKLGKGMLSSVEQAFCGEGWKTSTPKSACMGGYRGRALAPYFYSWATRKSQFLVSWEPCGQFKCVAIVLQPKNNSYTWNSDPWMHSEHW